PPLCAYATPVTGPAVHHSAGRHYLRAALSRALVAAEKRLGADVALADDHYWHLPVDEAFDMTREHASLTVGQLSDDLENLREAGEVEPETAWHELSHLIGLLRALERLAKS
ncbi:hypothetical protein ACFPJ1_36620, partial [Kribbella qitaiheensis]|uniref:hypothetical protein n=1 Tax=Kribbella qitaiheensis TaxID=1544730 RepID=UPI00360EEF06